MPFISECVSWRLQRGCSLPKQNAAATVEEVGERAAKNVLTLERVTIDLMITEDFPLYDVIQNSLGFVSAFILCKLI